MSTLKAIGTPNKNVNTIDNANVTQVKLYVNLAFSVEEA